MRKEGALVRACSSAALGRFVKVARVQGMQEGWEALTVPPSLRAPPECGRERQEEEEEERERGHLFVLVGGGVGGGFR